MSLSVQNISPNHVAFKGSESIKKPVKTTMENVVLDEVIPDINYLAGLVGWALMLVAGIGSTAYYGITQFLQNNHQTEIMQQPANNFENDAKTIDYKNV